MGINIGDMFSGGLEAVKQGMSDLTQQGGTAALGYLEQQAIQVLSDDKKQQDAKFQSGIQNILNRPSNPGSFGDYITSMTTSPLIKQYGVYIMIGLLGVYIVSKKLL